MNNVLQRRTPTLAAGKLRHRIQIVVPSSTQDSTGGFSLSANTLFATVWASVEALSGVEQNAADQQVTTVTHQIVIRYIGAAPSWYANTSYLNGALLVDSNGNLQQAQGAGTSGAAVPTWSTTLYGFTSDGDPSTGVTWKNLGAAVKGTGVTAAMQIVFRSRTFQIMDVLNPDERTKLLVLQCAEINDSRQQSVVGGVGGGGNQPIELDGGGF